MSLSVVVVACKSDLPKAIPPSSGAAAGVPFNVGLVEVSVTTDQGKKKIRDCFNWELKAIARHRSRLFSSLTTLFF